MDTCERERIDAEPRICNRRVTAPFSAADTLASPFLTRFCLWEGPLVGRLKSDGAERRRIVSQISLLRHDESVVYLNPEIANGALEFGVA